MADTSRVLLPSSGIRGSRAFSGRPGGGATTLWRTAWWWSPPLQFKASHERQTNRNSQYKEVGGRGEDFRLHFLPLEALSMRYPFSWLSPCKKTSFQSPGPRSKKNSVSSGFPLLCPVRDEQVKQSCRWQEWSLEGAVEALRLELHWPSLRLWGEARSLQQIVTHVLMSTVLSATVHNSN